MMENMLYPFKFNPILKDKIWGGRRMETILNKDLGASTRCGESWEVSGLLGDESVVANGFLAENNLNELIEVYLTEIVGEKNYDRYGLGFPLLIKFIDAQDNLSVQVHPDDELARRKYEQNGKTEMWHVIAADPGSGLYVGFNRSTGRAEFEEALAAGKVDELLRFHPVQAGDTFMIPAGTVHAIGKGVLLAEIQQPSDITFRVFDWNRVDDQGNPRELHVAEALEAIHFEEQTDNFKVDYTPTLNKTVKLVRSPFFNTSLLDFDQPLNKSFVDIDSFVVYICLEGQVLLAYGENGRERLETGEVVLVPADIEELQLLPARRSRLLEIYC